MKSQIRLQFLVCSSKHDIDGKLSGASGSRQDTKCQGRIWVASWRKIVKASCSTTCMTTSFLTAGMSWLCQELSCSWHGGINTSDLHVTAPDPTRTDQTPWDHVLGVMTGRFLIHYEAAWPFHSLSTNVRINNPLNNFIIRARILAVSD